MAARPARDRDPSRVESAAIDASRRRRRSAFYPKADATLDDETLRSLAGGSCEAIDPSDVAEACRSALGPRPVAVAPMAEQGTFHRLFRAIMPDGGSVVVRINAVQGPGRDASLLADRWAARRLRPMGLPVLDVFAVDLSRRVVPFDFLVMEEAEGRSLREFDEDDEAIRPLLGLLGRTVARVHRVELDGFGWVDPAEAGGDPADPPPARGMFAAWDDYVTLRLRDHVSTCVAIGAIDRAEGDRIEGLFRESAGLFGRVEPRLLHGDLGNHNVFVSGGEISALIDWEDCLAGDPAFDVAFWATFHPDRRLDAILNGYAEEGAPSDGFSRRFWLYYLRISLSKTVHRHRFGYVDRPGRAPAADRIRKALERLSSMDPLLG